MSKNLAFVFGGLVILLAIGGGYLVYQNQKLTGELTDQKSFSSPSPTVSPASPEPSQVQVSPSPTPTLTQAAVQENIEAAINSQNTAALATYMTTPKINFSLMSTECCEPQTPQDAVNQLSYISDGIPFDFNQNSTLIKNLKAKNPQLAGTFIGVSKTKEQLAAFTLNSQNRISAIQLSISWKLYNQ